MQWAIIDTLGRIVTAQFYENLKFVTLDRVTARQEGRWGVVDGRTGDTIIPFQFEELGVFLPGYDVARAQHGKKWGLVRIDGSRIGDWDLDLISYFSSGLAKSRFGKKVGFLQTSGEWGVQPIFSSAYDMSEGIAAVRLDGVHFGYIDVAGRQVIDFKCRNWSYFREGLVFACFDNTQGFFDRAGRMVLDGSSWGRAGVFSEGLCEYQPRGERRVGYLNRDGFPAFSQLFERASRFSEGCAAVVLNEKWGVIDTSGEFVISPLYDNIGKCSKGLLDATLDGKSGYLSKNGETVIPFEYLAARPFEACGYAAVRVS